MERTEGGEADAVAISMIGSAADSSTAMMLAMDVGTVEAGDAIRRRCGTGETIGAMTGGTIAGGTMTHGKDGGTTDLINSGTIAGTTTGDGTLGLMTIGGTAGRGPFAGDETNPALQIAVNQLRGARTGCPSLSLYFSKGSTLDQFISGLAAARCGKAEPYRRLLLTVW
ncbi:MAG TPA: hypothetical protein VJU86_14450 [Pyrinomonadaceae bacterium]|nr:hypothetical protein [Pyrinomonadaceae bacterium]